MFRVRILFFLFLSLTSSFFNMADAGIKAPMPPEIAVNHETRQCAQVMRGDECMICYLPEGWEILGLYPDMSCPAGYEMINLDLDCVENKACRIMTGQYDGSSDLPRGTLIGILVGLLCCGSVVAVIGVVVLVWLLNRRKKTG